MSKEAMKLALEALEKITRHFGFKRLGESRLTDTQARGDAHEAITALREALAEQPAQQEPVAWLEILRNNKTATDEVIGAFLRGHAEHLTRETFVLSTPAAPQPAQQQEPVKACVTGQCPCKSECDSAQCCLYTSPPARKPLSNFAKAAIYAKHFGNPVPDAWYAAINDLEAAHGIKGDA